MPIIGQDVATAFLADLRSNPNHAALFVQTVSGEVIQVYAPSAHLSVGALIGDMIPGTAVQVGYALYFAEYFVFGNSDFGFYSVSYISRLNKDGSTDRLTELPAVHGAAGSGDKLLTAFSQGGTYHIEAGSELYEISADGTVTQQSHLARISYPGALPGVVAVDDTVFLIGDQQTPTGRSELYRIRPNGAQELVFSEPTGGIVDVASFAGKAWFVSQTGDAQRTDQFLWTIGETGAKQKFDLGKGQEPTFLDTDGGGGLIVVYHPAGGAGFDSIARIATDGSVTTIMNATHVNGIFDVCTFAGQTYFTAASQTPGGGLYRVTANGGAELVSGIGHGAPNSDVQGMHVSGGKLWFTGAWQVSDGFGGLTVVAVSYSIDASGNVTVEGGLNGHHSDLFVIEGYHFTLDFPNPIFGGGGPDMLDGTGKSELVSGLNGNDTAHGLGGDDSVLGGDGGDVLFGDNGDDVIEGGVGFDRLSGGLGQDTLTGGFGGDHFTFDFTLKSSNADRFTDFASGLDHIDLSLAVMAQLGDPGRLKHGAFWSTAGATAGHDQDDRVIYNSATGALYYDADGGGSGRAVKIAELGPSTILDFRDIFVIE